MSDHEIVNDQDLRGRVRAETQYNDTPDELAQATLKTLVKDAKLLVQAKTDSTEWYTDLGLSLVLLGTTCAKAKASVENYSVESWNFGGGSITAKDSDGNSVQMTQYSEMISEGMKSSDTATRSTPTLSNTRSYISGRR